MESNKIFKEEILKLRMVYPGYKGTPFERIDEALNGTKYRDEQNRTYSFIAIVDTSRGHRFFLNRDGYEVLMTLDGLLSLTEIKSDERVEPERRMVAGT